MNKNQQRQLEKLRQRKATLEARYEDRCNLMHFESKEAVKTMLLLLQKQGYAHPSYSFSATCKQFHVTHAGSSGVTK